MSVYNSATIDTIGSGEDYLTRRSLSRRDPGQQGRGSRGQGRGRGLGETMNTDVSSMVSYGRIDRH